VDERLQSARDRRPCGTACAVVSASGLTNRQSRDFLGETNAAAFLALLKVEKQSLELEKTHSSDGKLWEMSFMKRCKCCSREGWLGLENKLIQPPQTDKNHTEVLFPKHLFG